ncbi:unnamed protein product, partial [Strongylus vulgaris]
MLQTNRPHPSQHAHRAVMRYILDLGSAVVTACNVLHPIFVTIWEDAANRIFKGPKNFEKLQGNQLVDLFAHIRHALIQTHALWVLATMGIAVVPVLHQHMQRYQENDWPIGPPGYGFPDHLANLDAVLVKAAGDGSAL